MQWVAAVAIDVACLALVAALGFAAQRASVCTVRAVEEVLSAHSAYMLMSFAKAALWASAIYGATMVAGVGANAGFDVHVPPALTVAGAFLFGVGAAIAGGCAMSVLQRLADGDLSMALTLVGLVLGLAAWSLVDAALDRVPVVRAPIAWHAFGPWASPLIGVVALLAIAEIVRLWRTRPRGASLAQLVAAPRYRLSTAALLIGAIGGVLYAFKGAWSYTGLLRTTVEAWPGHAALPGALPYLLFAALFAGMVVAALHRRSFRWRVADARARRRALAGGVLMGAGAGLVPGGNDTLLLTGVPTLSPDALGAYAALLAGIGATLLARRATGRPFACFRCRGDVYREAAEA